MEEDYEAYETDISVKIHMQSRHTAIDTCPTTSALSVCSDTVVAASILGAMTRAQVRLFWMASKVVLVIILC
jgi:ABC-type bacteriocin/lantibiotic exporter with double-glycine peptidase domain